MTELTKELLAEKIAQCTEALADLKKYQAVGTLEYLRANPDTYYAVCYRFISAIEGLFDIGQYILTDRGQRADSQREIPALLVREKIITDEVASRFALMYGFRNRLVHAYGTLDDAKVADYLANHLTDMGHILAACSSAQTQK